MPSRPAVLYGAQPTPSSVASSTVCPCRISEILTEPSAWFVIDPPTFSHSPIDASEPSGRAWERMWYSSLPAHFFWIMRLPWRRLTSAV